MAAHRLHPPPAAGADWPPPLSAAPPRTGRWRFAAHDGRVLRVDVGWPQTQPPPGGHPFLLALDGNSLFGTLLDAARTQGLRPGGAGLGEPVVVGLGYETEAQFDLPQRARDYLPPGSTAFRALLADELLPWLARLLPLDRGAGTLIGHSFGGFFAVETLLAMPGLFRTTLASSPSLWADRPAIAAAEAGFAARLSALPGSIRLLLTAGDLERATTPSADPALAQRLAERRVVEEAQALAARLRSLASARLEVACHVFAGEHHGSVVPAAISRAVRFSAAPACPEFPA